MQSRRHRLAQLDGPIGSIGHPAAIAACISVTISALWMPGRVSACTCPNSGAAAVWPKDGAADVPIDTPFVLWRYNLESSTDGIPYALTHEGGDTIPLRVTERLPAAFEGCGAVETLFLQPESPLEPGTRYTLEVGAESRFGSSFTTGAGTFVPEPLMDVELQYLLVQPPDCSGSDCPALAEARVDLGGRPQTPRWFVLESASAEDGRNAFTFWPDDLSLSGSWQLSVASPAGTRCIDVRVYGLEGVPLFEEHRCEPDRCALFDRWGHSTCGGPPYSGVDASHVPDRTCDDPPVLGFRTGEGVVYPDGTTYPDERTDAGVHSNEVPNAGCSIGHPQHDFRVFWWGVLALSVYRIRSSRARQG
jgi:hypothetical protein